jgi:hypothetical protein
LFLERFLAGCWLIFPAKLQRSNVARLRVFRFRMKHTEADAASGHRFRSILQKTATFERSQTSCLLTSDETSRR